MYDNTNTNRLICQEVDCVSDLLALSDKDNRGKKRRWKEYKTMNECLSNVYRAFDDKKASRLYECCTQLVYNIDSDNKKHLHSANLCKIRLCPICAWRRSLRTYSDVMKCIDYLNTQHNYQYLFVTLTVKNCNSDELVSTIDKLYSAVKKLDRRKEIVSSWAGWVRNLEVTHNIDINSPSYDTYHPHFHQLVAVKSSYFTRGNYISKRKLRTLWADCLGITDDDYRQSLQVNIKRCYGNTPKQVAEISKYASKANEYIIADDYNLSVDTVRTLDKALHNRRLVNYAKCFRDAKRYLKISDVEDADLIHIDDDNSSDDNKNIEIYWWYSGYRNYYRVARFDKRYYDEHY